MHAFLHAHRASASSKRSITLLRFFRAARFLLAVRGFVFLPAPRFFLRRSHVSKTRTLSDCTMATVQILNQRPSTARAQCGFSARPAREGHSPALPRKRTLDAVIKMHSIAASTSYFNATRKDVDGRDEPGHDARSRYGLISNSRAKAV